MKKTAIFFLLSASCALAADIYFAPGVNGDRWWGNTAAWSNKQLPTANDNVTINNANVSPQTPLIVSNLEACVKSVTMAGSAAQNPVALKVRDGGILRTETAVNDQPGTFVVGKSSGKRAYLLVEEGGTVSNRLFTIGDEGFGAVTNNGTVNALTPNGGTYESSLILGRMSGGTGIFHNVSGTYSGAAVIGAQGYGEYWHEGGTTVGLETFHVGRYSNGEGVLHIIGNGLTQQNQMILGQNGKGTVHQHKNLAERYLKVGGSSQLSELYIYEGATNRVGQYAAAGGYPLVNNVICDAGVGRIWLKGGAMIFGIEQADNAKLSNTNFWVRRYENATGELRGWGVLTPNMNNLRMVMNGTCVADAENVAGRELDLGWVSYVSTTIENGLAGTNGYYAVNGGKLIFPRIYFHSGQEAVRVAGCSMGESSNLVNSVRLALPTETGGGQYFLVKLYANDNAEVPSGLPTADGTRNVLGVWSIGTIANSASRASNGFKRVTPDFRYDQSKVKTGENIYLYRYANGSWTLLKTQAHNPANPRISVGLVESASGHATETVGFFAITAGFPGGTVVSLH